MTESDIPELRKLFLHFGEIGQGFGVDEYPCTHDTMEIMMNYYNVIIEERSTSKPVGMMTIGDSLYSRGQKYVDSSAFILPEFFGAGMGTEMVKMVWGISKDIGGYEGLLTDIVFNNMKTLRMNRTLGYTPLGCLPRSVRMVDHGWMDALLYCATFDNYQSFKEIMSAQKSKY